MVCKTDAPSGFKLFFAPCGIEHDLLIDQYIQARFALVGY